MRAAKTEVKKGISEKGQGKRSLTEGGEESRGRMHRKRERSGFRARAVPSKSSTGNKLRHWKTRNSKNSQALATAWPMREEICL